MGIRNKHTYMYTLDRAGFRSRSNVGIYVALPGALSIRPPDRDETINMHMHVNITEYIICSNILSIVFSWHSYLEIGGACGNCTFTVRLILAWEPYYITD